MGTATRTEAEMTSLGTMLPEGADLEARAKAIAWLESEFPTWSIDVEMTSGWNGKRKELWGAEKQGHHPQRALTAAKLHTRLDEYQERERMRRSFARD